MQKQLLIEMDDPEEIRLEKQLQRLRYYKMHFEMTYKEIAQKSGVPESTVKKVFTGVTKNPRKMTVEAIEKVLGIKEILDEPSPSMPANEPDTINYPRMNNGKLTLKDYYAIPDDRRVELIDGVIYDMASPSVVHQSIVTELVVSIANYIRKNKGNCQVYPSPIDVQLDCDEKTMVEPDVIVVCDPKKNIHRCIFGAPDFVCEIISPSSKIRDVVLKRWKYMFSGVREYWAVDPKKRIVSVYFFEESDEPVEYSFDDDIPVRIYGGKLKISLKEIGREEDEE